MKKRRNEEGRKKHVTMDPVPAFIVSRLSQMKDGWHANRVRNGRIIAVLALIKKLLISSVNFVQIRSS